MMQAIPTSMTQTKIATLNATSADSHGAKCAVCGKEWRVWYDAADRVIARQKCKCEK